MRGVYVRQRVWGGENTRRTQDGEDAEESARHEDIRLDPSSVIRDSAGRFAHNSSSKSGRLSMIDVGWIVHANSGVASLVLSDVTCSKV